MEFCELTQPLLDNEQSSKAVYYDNEASSEDSSFGYESTDTLDIENDTVLQPRDAKFPARSAPQHKVSAKVKSTGALCESLKLILDMPEMCDVTFLVGPKEIPVHGVRAILGTRSKVFYQLIIYHLGMREARLKSSKPSLRLFGDRLTIPVQKYDAEVFRMLVQFIHCGTATVTGKNVIGLLCVADQFELRDLEQACWEFIKRRVELDCGYRILKGAKSYRQLRKTEEIYNTISAMMDLISDKFSGLSTKPAS